MTTQQQYDDLVNKALIAYGRPSSYYAKRKGFNVHHVIPCCAFPHGRDDARAHEPSNLVYFTESEHAEAHRLLAELYPLNRGLQYAWNNMKHLAEPETYEGPCVHEGVSYVEYVNSKQYLHVQRKNMERDREYRLPFLSEAAAESFPELHAIAVELEAAENKDADFASLPYFDNEPQTQNKESGSGQFVAGVICLGVMVAVLAFFIF
ncbi:hypothetical protein BIW22_20670 [Salmonella enterica]|nr:hypothetical protein [Salmonella enterica]